LTSSILPLAEEHRVTDWFRLARPILHSLDPETAHRLTLRLLAAGLVPPQPRDADPILATRLFGLDLTNPLGLAAGFDKNAAVPHRMYGQGFGYVEVGGVTPLPQAGNPRPRLFRLSADQAVINRMGFNNDGLDQMAARLARHRLPGRLIGANLASNSASEAPVEDFATLVGRLAPLADFLTIDISCPNTRNGKQFQQPGPLAVLLARAKQAREDSGAAPHLVVKIAPDLDDAELQAIIAVVVAAGMDGLIVSNTTIARDGLADPQAGERGGLSGRPLFERSTELLRRCYALAGGAFPILGLGGIASGADAYAKIRAGASAVQLYTALVFHGPAVVTRIKRELAALLRRDGFASVAAAVGADHQSEPQRKRA
jgi:dihydroorotate dehydrogenase